VLEPVTRSGDEPQLLARNVPGVPVLVSADRYIAGLFAEKHFQPTVSILDDGFQHLQLERDVDLLLVSAADLDDRVLPSGRLREPIDAAQFADAVLVSDADADIETVAATLMHHRAFRVVPYYERPICRVQKDPASATGLAPGARIVAFAGIARPERFFNALRSLGYDVARELTFRDHHWYTAHDVETIRAAARDVNTDLIVTTEKDAVRCDMDAAVLPMTVSIEPAAQFTEWLLSRLH
jgi:tetraacyldisaccharide 4'-kinase